jgi:phage protein D
MSTAAGERHVALYTVLVDGREIEPQLALRVHEVRVVSYLRLPDLCTLSLSFPKGREGEDEPLDAHPFQIGKPLEIRLGGREQLATTSLFKGEIVTLEPEFASGRVELLVRGLDRSHILMRSRRVRTFQNQTSSDIVEKIVSEAGLSAACDASGEPHEFVQQDNETDWDFIWRLADRIGFEFVVEDQVAKFRKPGEAEAVELEWPKTLRSFSPRLTAVQQVSEVSLLAQDPMTKEAIDVSASSSQQIAHIGVDRAQVTNAFAGDRVHIATEPVKSEAEGEALAQALLDRLANGYVAAEGVCDGNPAIRAGASVRVSGVGQTFSGTYPISAATHILTGGSTYDTRFANSASHTLLGAVRREQAGVPPSFGSQLVLGIVTNNDDPESLGRVRVRYPALAPSAEGAWARVATPSAGGERGLLMLPVAGEEVLVGFEHDDTTRPYVLGSLFNGRDTPGEDLLQGQDGSFALKSDTNAYAESGKDLKLKSGGDWSAEIEGRASLTATQPFQIEGQNVVITGQTEVAIEGSATLTLTCGGTQIQLSSAGVQISGPMIKME